MIIIFLNTKISLCHHIEQHSVYPKYNTFFAHANTIRYVSYAVKHYQTHLDSDAYHPYDANTHACTGNATFDINSI